MRKCQKGPGMKRRSYVKDVYGQFSPITHLTRKKLGNTIKLAYTQLYPIHPGQGPGMRIRGRLCQKDVYCQFSKVSFSDTFVQWFDIFYVKMELICVNINAIRSDTNY